MTSLLLEPRGDVGESWQLDDVLCMRGRYTSIVAYCQSLRIWFF